MLVSAIQQRESAVSIHISPPSSASLLSPPCIPLLKVLTKHWAALPVLCSSFSIAIYFTHGTLYMSIPLSVCPSHSFPPWISFLNGEPRFRGVTDLWEMAQWCFDSVNLGFLAPNPQQLNDSTMFRVFCWGNICSFLSGEETIRGKTTKISVVFNSGFLH